MNRKILHAADIHLDSPLKKLDRYESAPAEQIRGASRLALKNLRTLAIDQDVDLVVIAGDLYDCDWTDQNTGLAFVAEAGKLTESGIPLLVIRGNHDAANRMTSSLPLPPNPDGSGLFLSSERPESRILEDVGIAVHGQSFRSRSEKANLARKYPDPVSGLFNLGLLHTALQGSSSHANYAPCTPQELTDKGYDYWALGHIHKREDFALPDGPPIVFSGNLQGRHIGEQGAKGCVIVEVDERNRCQYRFHPLDVLRWQEFTLDTGTMSQPDEVIDAYQSWLAEQMERGDNRMLVVRVVLTGRSELHTRLHQMVEGLRADLQAITITTAGEYGWLEDVKVRTRPPAEQGSTADLEGPLESVSSVLDHLRADPELASVVSAELAGLQRKLPKELRGQGDEATFPLDDGQWVGELVESAAAELLARLQQDETVLQSTGTKK